MLDRYLIIDTSTPNFQCGFVNYEGIISDVIHGEGDVIELLPNMAQNLLVNESFESLTGIIYCYGPGSALGLRACLMAINVWVRFCTKKLKLFRYSSLEMAANLTKHQNIIAASIGSNKYITRYLDGACIVSESVDQQAFFLQTRRLLPKCINANILISYIIDKYAGSIFDIANEIKIPDLFENLRDDFVKWEPKRHS